MSRNLIVGAGFSGACIARLIAEKLNEDVVVIDVKDHIAGNSYDFVDENGITIHKYGSHIFHTDNSKVWNFVTRFSNFNSYAHKVHALIDNKYPTIPFNFNTMDMLFSPEISKKYQKKLLEKFEPEKKIPISDFCALNDDDLNTLADYVYQKVYLGYSSKQWGVDPKTLDKSVTARVPVFLSRDNRYFQDKYQGIPLNGYSGIIKNMLNHKNIKLRLNTDFKKLNENFDRIFYTGAIDEYFNYCFGELPYRSLKFEVETLDKQYYQQNSVVNFPNDFDYTRIHEFKYYNDVKCSKTVIAREYPCAFVLGKNERYYPIINSKNNELYNKYLELAKKEENVYFLGRLGEYRYYDMDDAIDCAIRLFENLFN